MRISTIQGKPKYKDIDALIVPIALNEKVPAGLPALATQLLKDSMKRKEFSGRLREFKPVLLPLSGKTGLRRVFFIGVGKTEKLRSKDLGRLVGQAVRRAQNLKVTKAGFWFRDIFSDEVEHLAEIIASYADLAGYEFSQFQKKKKPQIKSLIVYVDSKDDYKAIAKGCKTGSAVSSVVNESRDLANTPSNEMTPSDFADFARLCGKNEGIKVEVLGEKDMEREGMGAILGVAKGSAQEAQFVVMEYWGADKKDAPFVIVGKGITFDTGGISIKPSNSMDEMKYDMCGGAAAIGIIRSAAALKLPLNVVALIPASENMPGHNAYKPGDVLKAMDGSTIEVGNTDAEGRLLLADALVYAREYKPKTVIDIATLTGACAIALHDSAAGMFTKSNDLATGLATSSDKTGDTAWRMPLPDDFKDLLKSKVADIANIAGTYNGGAITAAKFLDHFVAGKYPWTHLDIAGVAWTKSGKKWLTPGATGAGIRLVVDWLREQAN